METATATRLERTARRVMLFIMILCGAAYFAFGASRPDVALPIVPVRFSAEWMTLLGIVIVVFSLFSRWLPARGSLSIVVFLGSALFVLLISQRAPAMGDLHWAYRPEDLFPWSATDAPERIWKSSYDWMTPNQSRHAIYGFSGTPNEVAREKHRDFEVDYTHDSDGWRIMPPPRNAAPSDVVAFIGCSVTYGIGVRDEETYSAILAKDVWRDVKILNRSYSGWGTAHALLATDVLLEEPVRPKVIFYGFITNHLNRNERRKSWFVRIGDYRSPFFGLDADGDLIFDGLLPASTADAPDDEETSRREDELTLAMIREMNRLCQAAGIPLIILVLEQLEDRVVDQLMADSSLNVLDLHKVCYDFHPRDFHPTARWHRWIAHYLASDPRVSQMAGMPELYRPDAVTVDAAPRASPRFAVSHREANADFQCHPDRRHWRADQVVLTKEDEYELQLFYEPFSLTEGEGYVFHFRARADAPRTIALSCTDRLQRYRNLGLSTQLEIHAEWTDFKIPLKARFSTDDALFAFGLGKSAVPVELETLELRHGDRVVQPSVLPLPGSGASQNVSSTSAPSSTTPSSKTER